MTARKQALSDLLALVESGEATGKIGPIMINYWHVETEVHALSAYTRSLDSARYLQNAMLPGWTRAVDASAPECGITVELFAPGQQPDQTVKGNDAVESRAWLIAILKALIAGEDA